MRSLSGVGIEEWRLHQVRRCGGAVASLSSAGMGRGVDAESSFGTDAPGAERGDATDISRWRGCGAGLINALSKPPARFPLRITSRPCKPRAN
ncbi:MAG: hypothetical protein BRC54_00915 [Cyanobacteria bacterium SW_7_48_12]|nr:MAG: hypothetical protein BRC54_00915 [Cyanobacteria bacterium SW_7_48_12]